MEAPGNGSRVADKTEYYYDLQHRQLLVGGLALDNHLKSQGETSDIHKLRDVLLDDSIELPPFIQRRKPPRTKQELLEYGKWLCDIVGEPEGPSRKRAMNEAIIHRAGRFGIGPTAWEIKRHPDFGTLGRFYTELELQNTKRAGIFDDWTAADFGNYVRMMGKELGRKPTRDDFIARSRTDIHSPSLNVIIRRLGTLGNLYELGGYLHTKGWQPQDCVSWGIKFMEANDGLIPSQAIIDYFSTQKLSPSAATISKRFNNSLADFQSELSQAYEKNTYEQEIVRQKKLQEIDSSDLPDELFDSDTSDDEKILRYAKYIVVDELLSPGQAVSKLSISTESSPTVKEAGFVRSVRKVAPHVTAGDIESAALWMGVFDDIWPPNKDYLDELKVPQEMLTPRRLASIGGLRSSDELAAVTVS